MKKRKAYELSFNSDLTSFHFQSEGTKGLIEKVIEFSYFHGPFWNLGFGDVPRDSQDWVDTVVSDNSDMRKVLQTVVNAIHIFSEKYPDRKIWVEPVDRRRKLLYNRIFKEKRDEINLFFEVEGVIIEQGRFEPYDPAQAFDAFALTRKKSIFEDQTTDK